MSYPEVETRLTANRMSETQKVHQQNRNDIDLNSKSTSCEEREQPKEKKTIITALDESGEMG
jgi:hypothetical protein